jgi:nucleotide sugar dehydrogenase
MNIGIIGQGFVGSALREGLKNFYKISTYDIDETKCNQTLEWVCLDSDIIFVCLPTPMRKDGSCDTRILEKAIEGIEETCLKGGRQESRPILVIKSTIPPGTTERISYKYTSQGSGYNGHPEMQICFSPEFLTEANSFEDFKNQSRIIIGGPRPATGTVKQMFRKAFPTTPIIKTGSKTAEMVKYFTNCFLATKVTFANQMFQICLDNDIDYDKVCEYTMYDNRIGRSHLAVPGPDGDLGFGGHCFPKDLAAMISFGSINGSYPDFLQAVQDYNNKCRRFRDWEHMKGRAVSED